MPEFDKKEKKNPKIKTKHRRQEGKGRIDSFQESLEID